MGTGVLSLGSEVSVVMSRVRFELQSDIKEVDLGLELKVWVEFWIGILSVTSAEDEMEMGT